MWFAPDPSHEQRCKRLMAAAGRGDAAGITAELEGGLGDTAPLLAAAAWAAYRGSDAVLGALCGSPAGGQLLGRAPTSEEFYPYSEHLKFIAPLPFSPYTHLMHQSALVIAACRLHTNAVTLLLSRGARFPASAERDGEHCPRPAACAPPANAALLPRAHTCPSTQAVTCRCWPSGPASCQI